MLENDAVEKSVKNNYDFVDKKSNLLPSQQRKNTKKDRQSIIEIFQKMKKMKREIMLTIEIKVCQVNEERRKKSLKNMKKLYFYKRKYQSNIY